MLGLTQYFLRLRAAGVALMPSVAVALGLMGVSGATADDGARNPGSRTGTVLRYRIDAEGLRKREDGTLSRAVEVVRRRVDPDGSAGASVTTEGKDGITVEFAGLDVSEVKARIATPARLTFQFVDASGPSQEAGAGAIPPGDELLPDRTEAGRFLLLYKEAALGGDDFRQASAGIQPPDYEPCVNFELTAAGAAAFARLTEDNIGKRLAIVLDGKILSAPVIRSGIPGGKGMITGHFTMDEAARIALLLRSGSLPAPLLLVEERTIELTARRRE